MNWFSLSYEQKGEEIEFSWKPENIKTYLEGKKSFKS